MVRPNPFPCPNGGRKTTQGRTLIRDYQLLYGTSVEMTRRGIDGERSLRAMASFLNRKKLSPRERIECAADAPNPEKYLQKITP